MNIDEAKKKVAFVGLFCLLSLAYIVDAVSVGWYLGLFCILSVWFWVPISKAKRCHDCRFYDGPKSYSCIVEWFEGGSVCVDKCGFYQRKRWKFWRSK